MSSSLSNVNSIQRVGPSANHFSTRPGTLSLIRLAFCGMLHMGVTKAFPIVSIFEEDEGKPADDPQLWAYLGVAAALVLLGGAFAGLTIALMGQDEVYLQVLAESGEGSEKRHAKKVLKLLGRGKHWVLVTLLVGNVITNETLPIVLDRSIGGGYAAAISSTILVIIFGEIVPQSICVRYGLSIGAGFAPFVLVLMWLLAIVCWPIAKLLDYLLGKDHGTTYKKAGLKTLVTLHRTLGDGGERLNEDEVAIISGVLDLKAKSVGSIMTPMSDVFTLSSEAILDEEMMNTIMSEGYSRIPIHDPKNRRDFVGMLLVKMLITYDPEDAKAVNTFALATLPETAPETSCLDIINFFQEGKSHMVLVSDFPGEAHGALGVVTLEDVIEELIGEEIIDESDVYVDIHKAIRRTPAPTHRAHIHRVAVPSDTDDTLVSDQDSPPDSKREGRTTSTEPNPRLSGPLRRKSSTHSGQAMQRRNYTPELRAQLKNLGPSNSARHPKLTRLNTVKIKPGVGSIPENTALNNHAASAPRPTSQSNSSTQPLLAPTPNNQFPTTNSANLQAGYGTWDAPADNPAQSSNPELLAVQDGDLTTESEALSAAVDSNQQPPPSPAQDRPPKIIVARTDSHSTLGSLPSDGEDDKDDFASKQRSHSSARSRSRKSRSGARSGSITENIVDAGGVKKLVLGTVSSPSGSDEEDDDNNENAVVNAVANGRAAQADNNGEEAVEDGEVGDGDAKKRRRKRGKKKKGGEENQPLLGGES